MKKFLKLFNAFASISAFALIFTFASCSDDGGDDSNQSNSKISSMTLSIDRAEIKLGEKTDLLVAIEPSEVTEEIFYVAEPSDAVSIDEDGKVTSLKSGIVTIIAVSKLDPRKRSNSVTLTIKLEKPTEATKVSDAVGLWTIAGEKISTGLWIELDGENARVYNTATVHSKEDGAIVQKHYYDSSESEKLELNFTTKAYTIFDLEDNSSKSGAFNVDFTGENPTLTLTDDKNESTTFTWTDAVAIPYTEETMEQVFGSMTLKINFDSTLNLSKVKFDVAPAKDYKKYDNRIEPVEITNPGSTITVPVSGFFKNADTFINVLNLEAYSVADSNTPLELQLVNESQSYFEFVKGGEATISYAPVSQGTVGFKLNFVDGLTLDKNTDEVKVSYGSDKAVKDIVDAVISDGGDYAIAMFKKKYADSYKYFDSISVSVKKGNSPLKVVLGGGDAWFQYDETQDDQVEERTLKEKVEITGDVETLGTKTVTLVADGTYGWDTATEIFTATEMAAVSGAQKVIISVTGATSNMSCYGGEKADANWVGDIASGETTLEIIEEGKIAKLVSGGLYIVDGKTDEITVTVSYIAGSGTPPTPKTSTLTLTFKGFAIPSGSLQVIIGTGAPITAEVANDGKSATCTVDNSTADEWSWIHDVSVVVKKSDDTVIEPELSDGGSFEFKEAGSAMTLTYADYDILGTAKTEVTCNTGADSKFALIKSKDDFNGKTLNVIKIVVEDLSNSDWHALYMGDQWGDANKIDLNDGVALISGENVTTITTSTGIYLASSTANTTAKVTVYYANIEE